jgi:flavin reductase (DIM6/NTAB) family NADH-FMN oxidoreductase RutF
MIITKEEIEKSDTLYRKMFINSLAGFRQAVLVGTKSKEGQSNLAVFNSLIHLGANPALFGLISRPDTVQRDTLQNITDTRYYTLNYVQAEHYKKAHQTSARYPKGVSEFEQVGFEELYQPFCDAPFVKNAVVKIAMQLEETIPISVNGTILIIGSITHVDTDPSLIGSDGFIDLSAENILISQGLDAYFTSNPVGRLPYAKP